MIDRVIGHALWPVTKGARKLPSQTHGFPRVSASRQTHLSLAQYELVLCATRRIYICMTKRIAIYARTSTADNQTTENQIRELEAVAARHGWTAAGVYDDNGVSGATPRECRPAMQRLLKAVGRREVDMVAAWAVDRLIDLLGFLSELHAKRIDLYLHQQGLDISTPAGRAMFQMLGVFAEFERSMIRDRVRSGMERAKATGTKSGKAIGRPSVSAETNQRIRALVLAKAGTQREIAAKLNVSRGAVYRVCAALKAEAVVRPLSLDTSARTVCL
jgi:DNA invertase Pin-like site-specific DNA recombinase